MQFAPNLKKKKAGKTKKLKKATKKRKESLKKKFFKVMDRKRNMYASINNSFTQKNTGVLFSRPEIKQSGMPWNQVNMVLDSKKVQKYTNNTQESFLTPSHLVGRTVQLENGSGKSVRFTISTNHKMPGLDFYFLAPGQSMRLILNHVDSPQQFLWLPNQLPLILNHTSNQYVLRHGLEGWFIDYFHQPMYKPAS